jgi:hypothetical protein
MTNTNERKGMSPALRQLRSKMVVLTTMAEMDLKGQEQR